MTAPVLFQFLPPLSPEEYSSLEASIREHGVQVPIVLDENGVVIDGHYRQKIAQELGVHCPRTHVYDLSEAEKRTLALTLNLDRRNLTREQRRAIVEASLKADPQLSNREHARRTGVDDKTVGKARADLEATADIPQLSHTVGADGKSRTTQPARKPQPAPTWTSEPREVVDRETGEIVTDTPTLPGQTIQTTEHVVIAQTRHLDLDDQPDDEPEEQPRVTGRDGKQLRSVDFPERGTALPRVARRSRALPTALRGRRDAHTQQRPRTSPDAGGTTNQLPTKEILVSIEFVDTLPEDGRGGRAQQIRLALHEHPGKWAIVYRAPADKAKYLSGYVRSLKKGPHGEGIEAVQRTVDGEARIYARAVAR